MFVLPEKSWTLEDLEILKNLADFLDHAIAKYSWKSKQDLEYLKSLAEEVKQLRATEIPNHDSLLSIQEQVVFHLKRPTWWENVQFCFHYKAVEEKLEKGDVSQCSGPGSPLCAFVNRYTENYEDASDERPGWCELQWGINADESGTPKWFLEEVGLCFKYWADKTSALCGNGNTDKDNPESVCTPINQLTPAYKDDTDRRAGGCRMRWMIQTGISSPIWLNYSSICLAYDKNGGSPCGGTESPTCASANSWTGNFRDDTRTNATASCSMKWAVFDKIVAFPNF